MGNSGGNASGKKRKNEDGEVVGKKKRQSQSCDACRARKVKCDRPPPGGISPTVPHRDVCSHCEHLGLACTFDYKPKKRGPPNMYIRKLQASGASVSPPQRNAELDSISSSQPMSYPSTSSPYPPPPTVYPPNPTRQETSAPYMTSSGYYRNSTTGDGPGPGTLAEQRAMHGSALSEQGLGSREPIGRDVGREWEPALLMTIRATEPAYQQATTYQQGPSLSPGRLDVTASPSRQEATSGSAQNGPSLGMPNLTTSRPASNASPSRPLKLSPSYNTPDYPKYPYNPSNPFDQVLPRGLLYRIIDLYFDYIYCLIPCIHRPTFMADLHSHREEQPAAEEWTALVFSIVGVTLAQLPRAFIPMPRKEVKTLTERCYRLGRDYYNQDFVDITITRLIIGYLSLVTSMLMGYHRASEVIMGSTWILITRMRLHEESSYAGLPPIECQLRRRLFWLMYGADTTLCAVEGILPLIKEEDCCDVVLPAEIDDEYLTHDTYLEQPSDRTPILSGFYYISKLFKYHSSLIDKRRRDKRKPPSGLMLQMRINEVNELFEKIMRLMEDCPAALKLDLENDSKSITFSDDWDQHASNDIQQLFLNPQANHAVVKDAYLVQQGNIYVTQQMVRYMALQYRDELLLLQSEELAKQTRVEDTPGLNRPPRRQSPTRRAEWNRHLFSEEEKDQVSSDLLAVLQRIPIQVIAVNSSPLVGKVRFVASTLLDAISPPNKDGDTSKTNIAGVSQRTIRAQSYLWDFLRILSEIEALYSMEE
ncbi:fungal-specific transcription factor domain-domain-containing protein [Naematelia encephala]|uniref:Fungal-specific transcription factor domain-domain-containing protein n=1 Tax=Naematelia encephala TaxID=71784 RepID=A0A1Y2B2C3_9TREE|nr:fungal-specific transcription factor domain-domain-containing protein [Naematelia encephala]